MALPDYVDLVAGTVKRWVTPATAPDGAITLASLANNGGREGEKLSFDDATLGNPEVLEIYFTTKVQSAPTNGLQIELYFGESDSKTAGSSNPGSLTGADAAVTSPDEKKLQCNLVGGINLSNALGTGAQAQRFVYYPICVSIVPLVVNKSGQTLGATLTDHVITVTPYYRRIKD